MSNKTPKKPKSFPIAMLRGTIKARLDVKYRSQALVVDTTKTHWFSTYFSEVFMKFHHLKTVGAFSKQGDFQLITPFYIIHLV